MTACQVCERPVDKLFQPPGVQAVCRIGHDPLRDRQKKPSILQERRTVPRVERLTLFTTVIMRGEEVLAEVKSTWCCLDAVSLRPARLARDIAARFLSQN